MNMKVVCQECASAAGAPVDSSSAFTTAVIYGAVAALVGLAFYAGFTIVFHFYIGYVALAVGALIAKAMMAGSKGIGGEKYQVVAAVLTYLSISLASIPILIAAAYQSGRTDIDWGALAPRLLFYGFASPFLRLKYSVASGLIRLAILAVGLRIAVRLTAGKTIQYVKPGSGIAPTS